MLENQQIFGTYTILEMIGGGSGGTVFKAYHNRLEQLVVVKQLKNPKASTLNKRKEVDILKSLKHSFLPQVLDFIEMEGQVYTVMSFIPGKSFQQLLGEGVGFSRQELLRWGMQICSALNYLHTQKIPIIHGDIKPSNIMLTPEGDICLIDFNISFYLDENTVLGYTDGYTSPEQHLAVDSRRRKRSSSRYVINEKSDIYSVGATLYHLAMGRKRPNYQQEMDFETLAYHLGEPFANVIKKAADIEPDMRYESAMKMFQALKAIPKKDKRYRHLVRMHQIYTAVLSVLLVGFVILGGYGVSKIQDERYDAYNEIVDDQVASIEQRDFPHAQRFFEKAKDKMPSELEAYYQNAYALYLQGQYTECLNFIDNNITSGNLKDNQNRMVDVYALQGLSNMELGDAAAAVENYERAIGLGAFDHRYYRDYAVALAHNGQEKKAREILEDAETYGLDDGSIHYTKGELHAALNEKEAAIGEFQECIEHTEDSYMRTQAFVMESKLYEEMGQLEENRAVLLNAKSQLPAQDQMVILERLVQADIDLAEQTGESWYRKEAIDVLNQIIDNQWASYEDYDNLAILYQKQRDLTQVDNVLQQMISLYGKDYNLYKRYAFMEAERQNALSQEYRDYSQFNDYYQQAETMYYDQLKDNDTDAEMGLLENVYEQLRAGRWL